ncbi:MAG: FAD binding domain-containing protein [Syntrophales bacterium]|nr:FAD binding domain-containing protein [Syntrophales bacterium]
MGQEDKLPAGVTHSDIVANEFIQKRYSALTDAAGKVGSRQIRPVAETVNQIPYVFLGSLIPSLSAA